MTNSTALERGVCTCMDGVRDSSIESRVFLPFRKVKIGSVAFIVAYKYQIWSCSCLLSAKQGVDDCTRHARGPGVSILEAV